MLFCTIMLETRRREQSVKLSERCPRNQKYSTVGLHFKKRSQTFSLASETAFWFIAVKLFGLWLNVASPSARQSLGTEKIPQRMIFLKLALCTLFITSSNSEGS